MKKLDTIILPSLLTVFLICFPRVSISKTNLFINSAEYDSKKQMLSQQENGQSLPSVVVRGSALPSTGVSSITMIGSNTLLKTGSINLAEALSYAPGITVLNGTKNESRPMIRGLSSQRLKFFWNNTPVYEPYFESVDLNMLPCFPAESILLARNNNSIIYGPNAPAGILKVKTVSPERSGSFFRLETGANHTEYGEAQGAFSYGPSYFLAGISGSVSDGYEWNNDGDRQDRENSDYDRRHFYAQTGYSVNQNVDIKAYYLYSLAVFGIPPATGDVLRQRYWRFTDWQRSIAGLEIASAQSGSVKNLTVYYTKHKNELTSYTDENYSEPEWISSYDNPAYGVRGNWSFTKHKWEHLVSGEARQDNATTQPDTGAPADDYSHSLLSAGWQCGRNITSLIHIEGGTIINWLHKDSGNKENSVDPYLTATYVPSDNLVLTLTANSMSGHPSMKEIYDPKTGNPDIKSERIDAIEMGVRHFKFVQTEIAVFHRQAHDLISISRQTDDSRQVVNIGKATISGIDIGLSKDTKLAKVGAYCTLSHTVNHETDKEIDNMPSTLMKVMISTHESGGYSADIWAVHASQTRQDVSGTDIKIPSYTILNTSIHKKFSNTSLYARINNIFDKEYYSEAGYPMPGIGVYGGVTVAF